MDEFDELVNNRFEETQTPLEKFWSAVYPEWEESTKPFEGKTILLKDKAGLPYKCSVCEQCDKWSWNGHKWQCSGEHEPLWIGRGYIQQIIEVDSSQVIF